MLVIIDSPDFTHRVARRVRAGAPSIPIVDYVSPSVWAWRPWRARAMRAYVDCVLAILPFEPAAHRRLGGPPCIYVGHPLVERLAELRPNAAGGASAGAPIRRLCWSCPAAASSEIGRLLAIFGAAIARRRARGSGRWSSCCRPCRISLRASAQALPAGRSKPRIVVEPAEKWAAFRSARAALAASGTVTLELALAGVPTVAAYRGLAPRGDHRAVRGLSTGVETVILANLVLGENIVPEFLQRDCTPEAPRRGARCRCLSDTPERRRQIEGFRSASIDIMALNTAPSAKAAAIVLDAARTGRGRTCFPPPRRVNCLFAATRYHHTSILLTRATRDRIILTVHGRMTKKSKKHKSAVRAAITGVHGYVPPDVLTNAELSRMVDTSDEWIVERTGIKERHILKGKGLGTSHMGAEAVRGLLKKTGTAPGEVDLLICATTTPDFVFPSTANLICDMAGIRNIGSFDVQAACSGFVYALTVASQFIETGKYRKVVVVGADKMSAIIDYTDRATCVLFGDGAGAVLIEPSQQIRHHRHS